MKKILITISIALFALTSCSSDDSSGSSSSTREKLKENQMKMISSFSESELSDKDKKAYSKYIDCYVDAIYDNLSEDAIKKLSNVDSVSGSKTLDKDLSKADQKAITEAASKCASKMFSDE